MRKRPPRAADATDVALFRESVGEVRPVVSRRQPPDRPKPRPRARFSRADEASVLEESLDMSPADIDIEHADEIIFRRDSISPGVLRKLRRGDYRVQDELDLHGMTAVQARTALRDFLREAGARDLRCVRIIHGKGLRSGARGPVLKASVNRWLRQWQAVLAFASAPERDGGTGAVYVLLDR